ncbi:MAG: hypothetical protein VYC80_09195 [Planctomycetota bacterium]|nr:hypothetical protein [Planctomycetota bacterium]
MKEESRISVKTNLLNESSMLGRGFVMAPAIAGTNRLFGDDRERNRRQIHLEDLTAS